LPASESAESTIVYRPVAWGYFERSEIRKVWSDVRLCPALRGSLSMAPSLVLGEHRT